MTRALATGLAVEGLEWWNGIDESEQWQKGIYSALSSSYGLLSIIALVQLIRIQIRVPEFEWTTQKGFHLMNFIVNGLRAIIFGLYKSVFLIRPKVLEMVVMEIPGLLFFSTYTLLVLFWAEIYHQARSLPIRKLKPTYCIINGVMYIIQICIWIIVMLDQSPGAVIAAKLFFSVVAFSAAVGFLIYGGRLFVMLRQFPIESRGRQKKLYEVGFVTSICFSCFSIRCLVLALSAFDKDADLDVLDHPILNLIYYLLVEIVPSALVLFILRKLPPRRISDRYHPIE
ncbi:tobamovirus multiplication protein 1-like [Cucurbita moschata]|uniref:Tobamovirus multiplication protein 1-like n=1 Tax=Cucurbita moschata TaxID=3662 RepID=A0A6J1HJF7_CUCMO|nr:tobamovirus multiplication protein 1-like [Cucurbita moschata]XP_022963956.1 tobamovirus multiplication protein 1-like [Cucurbita moschata]